MPKLEAGIESCCQIVTLDIDSLLLGVEASIINEMTKSNSTLDTVEFVVGRRLEILRRDEFFHKYPRLNISICPFTILPTKRSAQCCLNARLGVLMIKFRLVTDHDDRAGIVIRFDDKRIRQGIKIDL